MIIEKTIWNKKFYFTMLYFNLFSQIVNSIPTKLIMKGSVLKYFLLQLPPAVPSSSKDNKRRLSRIFLFSTAAAATSKFSSSIKFFASELEPPTDVVTTGCSSK